MNAMPAPASGALPAARPAARQVAPAAAHTATRADVATRPPRPAGPTLDVRTRVAAPPPLLLPGPAEAEFPDTDYRSVLRAGLALLVLGLGGFLAWAGLAPLDEAIPAPGVVAVESNSKRIEHLNGGIVEEIAVREGQRVKAGDVLLVLNKAVGQSQLNTIQGQRRAAMANLARLRAEREGAAKVTFPPELLEAAGDPEAAALMQAQEALFRSRRNALEGELRILRESVRGLESQLGSLEQLKKGRETQIALFNEQLKSYRNLRAEGFVSRNNLLDLERQLAEIQSKQSEDLSNIAGINARLAEFRMRGTQREIEYRREVETQTVEFQRELSSQSEKLAAQQDSFDRLVLRSPVAGTVVDLAIHTVGGVVKPGERVMNIVPVSDTLVIDARMPPQYVDRVSAGLPADVRFDEFASRTDRPVIQGTVAVVSADALVDERRGHSYYSMRVKVDAQELKKLGRLQLQPGMPATVMVKTGERTLLAYLMQPLTARLQSALTEH